MKAFRLQLFVALGVLSCLLACNDPHNSVPTQTPSQWVVAWGASPQNAAQTAENQGGTEQSFRFMILPTIAATQERVHFSNYFGATPITIGAARLAVALTPAATPAVDPAHDAPLTFNGSTSVTLQPNQEIDSDPVKISYTFCQWLAVSMYVQGVFPPLTEHDSQVSTNFATAPAAGDQTADAAGDSFTNSNTEWFLVTSVDAYGPYSGTVAFFGSSSVDGHNSNFGSGNSYPTPNVVVATQNNDRPTDWLARSLNSAGYHLGVLNAGLLGNPAAEDGLTHSGFSTAGIDRFKHDVLQQPGITSVIIYTGGVDLRLDCLPATNVEASLTNLVAQASAAGVRVILATIPPAEYCLSSSLVPTAADPYNGDLYPGPENPASTERRAVNTWIRTSGAQLPGVVAVADFDQALTYPTHPDFYLPALYSTDNFHPNGMGYGVQNSAIALSSPASAVVCGRGFLCTTAEYSVVWTMVRHAAYRSRVRAM